MSIFIKYALTHLPNGSFIIFFFDSEKNIFVQFRKGGEYVYLMVPFWKSNEYEGKRAELSELISKSNIKKSSVTRKNYGKGKIDVSICFHKNYAKGEELTFRKFLTLGSIISSKKKTLMIY